MPFAARAEQLEACTAGSELSRLTELVGSGGCVVLSGAGLSTESGIPDYRGPDGTRRVTPMQYAEFAGSSGARQRYWARSYIGWQRFSRAEPNTGHRAVAWIQQAGLLRGLVTQNVDGLHQAAGARDVVELHGALDRVVCLGCRETLARTHIQEMLTALNPGFDARATEINPDGDAELPASELDRFAMADCPACGDGPLKPDVVFFGETVPRDRVDHCFGLVEQARSLLVLGSSLTVMSGYRFVIHAAKRGIPVAIVNSGPTRGDAKADLKLDAPLGRVLPELVRRLA
jgi:NAD-dependent SIR2 family protein deacetylase